MDVDEYDQALMRVKLEENVRKLIRDEIKSALEDPVFLGNLAIYNFHSRMQQMPPDDATFRRNVRDAMKRILDSSY